MAGPLRRGWSILVPIIVVSQKNLDQMLPTIKRTVFANELKK